MKIELSTYEAADILLKDEYANWSRAAALALIEYYEALEDDLVGPIDLDPVALRCDWTEYSSIEGAGTYYPAALEGDDALEYFTEHTNVIVFEGGILIQQF